MRALLFGAALLAAVILGGPVRASGFSSPSSGAGEEVHFPVEQVIAFAKKVERTLAAKGARVALVGRVGVDPKELPEGMHFSHVGFAVYSQITLKDGRKVPGYAMWNLYQEDAHPAVSDLVQDYPADFFAAVTRLEAGVVIPSPELQNRLLEVIGTPAYTALHDPHYSLIANPYTLGRQNCTEFVLDVLNAAIYRTADIGKIKAAEKQYFVAQPVNINPLKLLLGSMFMEGVSMSDQTTGTPVTATMERIGDYLKKYDKGAEVFTILPDR